MFEPFVTTKGGKGTGLGLWIVKGIVENHTGRIHVRSKVGQGNRYQSGVSDFDIRSDRCDKVSRDLVKLK